MTTIDPANLIGLSHVRPEISALTDDEPQTRRKLYEMCVNGDLPMAQFIRGRWYFSRADLPDVVLALGLRLKRSRGRPATKAPVRTSRSRAA